jgi:hypothetical protein
MGVLHSNQEIVMGFGATAIAIAFWVFVGVTTIAGIIADYMKRKAVLEPLRLAIERGQQLDPGLVEKLLAREQKDDAVNPEHLQLAGIITTAAGVGVALLSAFIGHIAPAALYPILGGGVVAICVGVGLLVAARAMVASRRAAAAMDANADRSA